MRTLKVRLIVSIFVMITAVYGVVMMMVMFAHDAGFFAHHDAYARGRFGLFVLILVFFFISVIMGIIVFYKFNQLFLKPLNELSSALKQVEKGNYGVVVKTNVRVKEIRRLMFGFNRMAKEISSVELLKKDFISYFSHEFKTPITSIRGFSRQLKEQELDAAKQKEYIEIIYRESNRLTKMSSNVLMLTKLEHQQALTDVKLYELDEQLRRTILLLEKQWIEKKLELVLDLEAIKINSNEEMVKQIWVNVIGNAIHYSHPGQQLKIRCKQDGKFAKIRIRDDGVGMSDQVRARIFEKFYQGDTSRGTSGNGVGMSIVKRIVDLCGGKIMIKSQVGKGTTVLVYLPMEHQM